LSSSRAARCRRRWPRASRTTARTSGNSAPTCQSCGALRRVRLRLTRSPCRRLKNAFPHVETAYLEAFVNGLAQDAQDLTAYRNRIRDLLVVSKELSAGEGAAEELFAAEDQEEKRRAAAAADERRAAAVPGMLKPSMVKVSSEQTRLHWRAGC
jgi:hypothetical protein